MLKINIMKTLDEINILLKYLTMGNYIDLGIIGHENQRLHISSDLSLYVVNMKNNNQNENKFIWDLSTLSNIIMKLRCEKSNVQSDMTKWQEIDLTVELSIKI